MPALSGKNIWKAVERATNVAVILGVLLFGVLIYRNYRASRPDGPRTGTTLPALTGYNWQQNPRTLVLALRKGCHFCENSMPFYRKLYGLEKTGGLNAGMVAVFPDSAQDAYAILNTQRLPIPSVSQFNLSRLSVSGTPTLILVDKNGKVEKAWVGELDSAGETGVLSAVQTPSP